MNGNNHPEDTEFDLRAQAELALAFEPGDPPAHLLRHTPWYAQRSLQRISGALLISAAVVGAVLAMRPPELVRYAIGHEYHERTLRGTFMPAAEIARRLDLPAGQALPGYTQLMRPCDIDGDRAYHLTTFFEKGGIVTVLSFEQFQRIPDGEGWWSNIYWKVVRSHEGRPLILIAQKKQALSVASCALGGCRTWGVDSENRPQRGHFLPDLPPHGPAMGQKAGEKWTAAVDLQPTLPKSDSLPGSPEVIPAS